MSDEQNPVHGSDERDSEVEAVHPRGRQQADQGVLVAPAPGCRMQDEEYYMKHPRRGVAVIFNHYKYADPRMKNREGTQQDSSALIDVLTTLGFDVRPYDDLTYKRISAVLEEVSLEDHTNADCLFVAVMTHGRPGELAAYDTMYPTSMLWAPFVGNRRSSLVGKPKIFVIQACRGQFEEGTFGMEIEAKSSETDQNSNNFINSDLLLAHSPPEGFYSWRRNIPGPWFIQYLADELQRCRYEFDLLTILTFVNLRVAEFYQSQLPRRPELDGNKIIPSFTSMLTRLVFFR